jgi:NitT/TauT family transport system ATP-binding protein
MVADGIALKVKALSYSYRSRGNVVQALCGLSFAVRTGEVLSVVGRSGAGKSTLLHILSRLLDPDEGQVEFPAFETPPRIGYMFQSNGTFPWRTVERNLTYSMEISGAAREHRISRARQLCSMVGLDPVQHLDKYPNELSGGQVRRVELAMAFAQLPQILLVDEPTSSVDWITRRQLQRMIQDVASSSGVTLIVVTHDIEEAVWLSDRVIALDNGFVADSIEIDFPRPRSDELRTTEAFSVSEDRIIRSLTESASRPPVRLRQDFK